MVQHKSTNIRDMQREFSSRGFEGRYFKMESTELPMGRRSQRETMEAPDFVTRPQDVEVELGGSAEFTCEVSGKPKPEVLW